MAKILFNNEFHRVGESFLAGVDFPTFCCRLRELLRHDLPGINTLNGAYYITYEDNEGDRVTISSQEELEEARNCHGQLLRLFVGEKTSHPASDDDVEREGCRIPPFAINRLALHLMATGKVSEARDVLKHGLCGRPNHPRLLYNLACTESLLGNLDEAVEILNRAVENGYSDQEHMENDKDFDNIRSLPGYNAIIERMKSSPKRPSGWCKRGFGKHCGAWGGKGGWGRYMSTPNEGTVPEEVPCPDTQASESSSPCRGRRRWTHGSCGAPWRPRAERAHGCKEEDGSALSGAKGECGRARRHCHGRWGEQAGDSAQEGCKAESDSSKTTTTKPPHCWRGPQWPRGAGRGERCGSVKGPGWLGRGGWWGDIVQWATANPFIVNMHAHGLMEANKLDEAKRVLLSGLAESPTNVQLLYNLACVESLLGNAEPAVEALNRAVEYGFNDFEHLQNDPDFDRIRSHPTFQTLATLFGPQPPAEHDADLS